MLRLTFALAALLLAAAPSPARAHCDTLDGPVVKAGRASLETGRPGPALAWVKPADEAQVRSALERARRVRKLGPEARALADEAFLETLVRLHRAGEGAPYTGLKPAGLDPGPAIRSADRAAASRSAAEPEALLVGAVREGLHRHHEALAALPPPGDDVAAGRAWVAAYVAYVHWVERVHQAATGGAPHAEGGGDPAHEGGHPEHAHPR